MAKSDYASYSSARILRGLPPRTWGYADPRQERNRPTNEDELQSYLILSNSPVAERIRESELAPNNNAARWFKPDKEKIQRYAKEFVAETRTAWDEYDRDMAINAYQDESLLSGRNPISEQQAIRRLNRDQQIRAAALLTVAQAGDIKLTDVQTERLNRAMSGEYYQMIRESSADKWRARRRERMTAVATMSRDERNERRMEFRERTLSHQATRNDIR